MGVSETVAGFLGVLLGGIITGGVTYWMQWRRERREARGARRVVESEIDEATAALTAIKGQEKWPPGWIQHWSESWEAVRPALALDLSDDSFKRIAEAYLYMSRLETGLAGRPHRGFVETDGPFLEEVSNSLDEARAALRQREGRWL